MALKWTKVHSSHLSSKDMCVLASFPGLIPRSYSHAAFLLHTETLTRSGSFRMSLHIHMLPYHYRAPGFGACALIFWWFSTYCILHGIPPPKHDSKHDEGILGWSLIVTTSKLLDYTHFHIKENLYWSAGLLGRHGLGMLGRTQSMHAVP